MDETPLFGVRSTGRGRRRVLARFMDAKSLYRQWSGGIGIHCGETAWETERDLCMLFGPEEVMSPDATARPWDGSTERLHRDLAGANGWESIRELLGVLNRAANYVAIHYGDDNLAATAEDKADIDILTEDYYVVHTILSSGRFMRPKLPNGGRISVRIGQQTVQVGLRFPGDNYFDEAWSRRLLSTRVFDDCGYYRPADEETFWVLAYHELMRRGVPGSQVRQRLLSMADSRGLAEWKRCFLEDEEKGRRRMVELLEERGIACPRPLDRGVPMYPVDKSGQSRLQFTVAGWQNSISVFAQRLSSAVQTAYWPVRDGLLIRAPWLSKVKHWRRLLT